MDMTRITILLVTFVAGLVCGGESVNDFAPRASGIKDDFWDMTKRPLTELSTEASSAGTLDAQAYSGVTSVAVPVDARAYTCGFSDAKPLSTDGVGLIILIR